MSRKAPASRFGSVIFLISLFLIALTSASLGLQRRDSGRSIRQRSQRAPDKVREWPEKSKRWALIIGVNDYNDKAHFQTLHAAVNDAEALRDTLVNHAGFPEDQVVLLTSNQPENQQPTRSNIYGRIGLLQSNVPKDGLLVIAFSGHGMERSRQVFLAPSDTQAIMLEQTALSATDLMASIKSMGVSQVLFLLDACRNNPTGRGSKSNGMTSGYKSAFDFHKRNREVEAYAILFATGVGEVSWENSKTGMGYFTEAVVEGLKGAAANDRGEVTLERLVDYLQTQVPARTRRDLGEVQKPKLSIDGFKASDLVIAYESMGALAANAPVDNAATLPILPAPTKPSASPAPATAKPSVTLAPAPADPYVITEPAPAPAKPTVSPEASAARAKPSASPGTRDVAGGSPAPAVSITVVTALTPDVEKITIERKSTGVLQAEPRGSLAPKDKRNGVLFVLVSPPVASVVIKNSRGRVVKDEPSEDGELRSELPPGIYDVEVYAPNCLPSTVRTSVLSGSPVRVPLELTPATGSVLFESVVTDATILVNGRNTADLNLQTKREGNRIELIGLRAGFHSFGIAHPSIRDWAIDKLEVQGGAVTRIVPIFKPAVVLASEFSDDFSRGSLFWTIPQKWSINQGMVVRDSGLGVLRDKVYQNFRMEFEVSFVRRKDVAWVVRAKDGKNYYMFHLSGPGSALPYRFRTFICVGGVSREISDLAVPKELFTSGPALRIVVEARGQNIRHSIQFSEERRTVQTHTLSDKTFAYGLVGFNAVPGAEARIRFVRIAPIE